MPSSLGIVASGEDVLNDAVLWLDASLSSVSGGKLTNLGKGGSALDAQFGSTTSTDTNDPLLLTHTGTNYLYLPGVNGNQAQVPDLAAYTPTTSISYRFAVALDDWTPGAISYLGGQYEGTINQRSSLCAINITTGIPFINLSVDGTAVAGIGATTAPTVTDGSILIVRYDWIAAGTVVRFYTKVTTPATAHADALADTGWTQLGADVTAGVPASLFAASAPLYVAGYSISPISGKHYATVVKVDGTTQVSVDFTTGITSGAQTTFTESSFNAATVTINRATSGRKSVAVTRPTLLFGTDDYLEVADNDLLDFDATTSFTALVVIRQWTTATAYAYMQKNGGGSPITGWAIGVVRAAIIGDGVLQPVSSIAPSTIGALSLRAAVRNVGTDTLYGYVNNAVSLTSDITTTTLANAKVLRIGSEASALYQDFEFIAAAVFRRALTANEIATIVARYT